MAQVSSPGNITPEKSVWATYDPVSTILNNHIDHNLSDTNNGPVNDTNTLLPQSSTHQRETMGGNDVLMSLVTARLIETVVQVGILPPLCVCGVTMNVFNMAVFLRQGLTDRINICLFCLAVCDAGYLLFNLVAKLSSILSFISMRIGMYWRQQSLFLVSVHLGFLNTANCLTLLISVERCVCVVWPLKAKSFMSIRFTKLLILLAFIVCFCNSCLTFFFISDVQSVKSAGSNITEYRLKNESARNPHRQLLIQVFENTNMLILATSLFAVMAATVVIAVRMRFVIAWRRGMSNIRTMTSSSEHREASVTKMLVVVCAIFSLCNIPSISHLFLRFFSEDFAPAGKHRNAVFALAALMHVILSINSTCNFLVYLSMSTKFKNTLKEMLKRTSDTESKTGKTGDGISITDSRLKTSRTKM